MKYFLTFLLTILAGLFIWSTPAQAAQIQIRARGSICNGGYPNMQLKVGGSVIQNWTVNANWQTYTANTGGAVASSSVAVAFTNDCYSPPRDRNLEVDYINIDGTTYQTEDPSVYSTGTWAPADGCAPGYKQSQLLACNGEFQYANNASGASAPQAVSVGSCSCQISDPGTLTEGNNFTVSAINCSGFPNMNAVRYYWDQDKSNGQADSSHTDDTDGDNTNTSGTMNYTGLSGSNQISKTISLFATDATSTAYTERSVNVRVKDPITGTVYEDSNPATPACDAVPLGGASVSVTAGGAGASSASSLPDGSYQTADELDRDRNYTVSASKAGYTPVTTTGGYQASYSVPGGATGVNFCLTPSQDAWSKFLDGDVRAENAIDFTVPLNKYLTEGVGSVISALTSISPSSSQLHSDSSKRWQGESYTRASSARYNFAYYQEKLADKIAGPYASLAAAASAHGGTLPALSDLSPNIAQINNTVTINTGDLGKFSGNPTLVLVNGDLIINNDFVGKKIIFIVSGNASLHKQVRSVAAGILADGIFNTSAQSINIDDHEPLNMWQGFIRALGQIILKRNFNDSGAGAANINPAETFQFNPLFLGEPKFREALGESQITWLETK